MKARGNPGDREVRQHSQASRAGVESSRSQNKQRAPFNIWQGHCAGFYAPEPEAFWRQIYRKPFMDMVPHHVLMTGHCDHWSSYTTKPLCHKHFCISDSTNLPRIIQSKDISILLEPEICSKIQLLVNIIQHAQYIFPDTQSTYHERLTTPIPMCSSHIQYNSTHSLLYTHIITICTSHRLAKWMNEFPSNSLHWLYFILRMQSSWEHALYFLSTVSFSKHLKWKNVTNCNCCVFSVYFTKTQRCRGRNSWSKVKSVKGSP